MKDTRQGWAIFAAFSVMFLVGVFVCLSLRAARQSDPCQLGIQSAATAGQSGGNMEGKEVRFGIANSALFATVTTDASCGAVNSMHDSFTPLGGLVPLFNIMTGEVIFGGVGAGLYGILLYCILAVFIAGLMVGRTPEYLGKKIEQKEVKMAMLAVIATRVQHSGLQRDQHRDPVPGERLLESARRCRPRIMNNSGPHGFGEILYAYVSSTGEQRQRVRRHQRQHALVQPDHSGWRSCIGRFLFLIPLLAAAGSLAVKKKVPSTAGTFPDPRPAVCRAAGRAPCMIVGALTFFPALSLGPIVEHYLMHSGKLFSTIFAAASIWS